MDNRGLQDANYTIGSTSRRDSKSKKYGEYCTSTTYLSKERNSIADELEKDGTSMKEGQWNIEETNNETSRSYMHAPFMI